MAAYILLRAHSELLISIINSEMHCSAAEVHFKSSSVQEMQISQTSLKEYKNPKRLTWLSTFLRMSSSDILSPQFSPIKVQFEESSLKETSTPNDKKVFKEKFEESIFDRGHWGKNSGAVSAMGPLTISFFLVAVFSFWSNHAPAEHNSTAIKLSVIFN